MTTISSEIKQFLHSDDYILRIHNNKIQTVNRYSICTWFAKYIFHSKNYELQYIVDYLKNNAQELNTLDGPTLDAFTKKLSERINHFNDNHPKRYVTVAKEISHLFNEIHSPKLRTTNKKNEVLGTKNKDLLEAWDKLNKNKFETIAFYKTGWSSFLGNFFETKVDMSGRLQQYGFTSLSTYECAEGAFQHIKWWMIGWDNDRRDISEHPLTKELVSANGQKAYEKSRELEGLFPGIYPENWQDGVRYVVMWEILNAKFQDPDLKKVLEATGDAFLIEHNESNDRDDYWSDNNDGKGHFDEKGQYNPGKNRKVKLGRAGNVLGLMLMAIRDGKEMPKVTQAHLQATQKHLRNAVAFSKKHRIF